MPSWVLRELNSLVFKFFWKGKPDLVSRAVVVQPNCCGGFSVVDVNLKVSAFLLQWIRRFASSPNSWVSFLVYWFNLRLGLSPVQVFANPPVFMSICHPFMFLCSVLGVWLLVLHLLRVFCMLAEELSVLRSLELPPSLRTLCFWLTTLFLRKRSSFLSLVHFINLPLGVSCSSLISIALSLTCLGRLPMGSSTLPSVCPLLVMICRLPLSAVTIWSLWTIFSSIVRWLLVFSHGFNCYSFVPLLWPLLLCVAMRFLVSRRMSSVLFLFSLSTLSMMVNSTFGWLVMIFVFGIPLLVRSMSLRVSNVVSLFTCLCSFRCFRSPRRRRYFVRQWGARGTIASVSDGNLSVHLYGLSLALVVFVGCNGCFFFLSVSLSFLVTFLGCTGCGSCLSECV